MSNVTVTKNMFSGTEATIGYAKTQADVDIFNNSLGKPSSLIFSTK